MNAKFWRSNSSNPPTHQPNYGIDAPGLVKFFFGAGASTALLAVAAQWLPWATTSMALTLLLAAAAAYLLGMGCLMIYSSKVMKPKDNEKLLNLINWSGHEQVLDVGCGRGMMLITAAKRLTTGKATGIDLWFEKDQSNNNASATLAHAAMQGVAPRVVIETADMRKLPFADAQFDVITSNWTVHNLHALADRQAALSEMIRVLKPSGIVLLNDIVNHTEYASYFQQRGMKNVQLHQQEIRNRWLRALSFGSFAPCAVMAQKAS